MDTNKLAAFVDLAQTLSYTETAAHRYTTQATISKQIMAFEKELNVQLIDRSHRQISLTWAGQTILPFAREILGSQNAMMAELNRQQKSRNMALTIHSIPSIAQYKAFNLMASFTHAYPKIDLHFAESETPQLLPSLNQGESDVIFTRLFGESKPEYDTAVIDTDRFVVVMPKGDSLADTEKITIDRLRTHHFLMLDETTNLYQPVMTLLTKANIKPKVVYKGERIDLILGMVSQGMGVSIMMAKSLNTADLSGIVTVPLEPGQTSQLVFMRRKDHHTPASDLFWSYIQP
ncbi:LysR family transcriptional regulator [Secundilactobacillus folii]|nr:LysR family transcriptional regulator [Secundilactobacillus folii]